MNEATAEAMTQNSQSAWTDLYRQEDCWANWLGFLLIIG